jgi:hypothetical protein
MAGLTQPFTGPMVNAMLILTTLVVGMKGGVAVGALTPWIAFIRGIIPASLAPMIPFIMLGNAVMVIVFCLLIKRNQWVALALGALAKYMVVITVIGYVLNLPPKLAQAFQIPQLYTAFAGGAFALFIYRMLPVQYRKLR